MEEAIRNEANAGERFPLIRDCLPFCDEEFQDPQKARTALQWSIRTALQCSVILLVRAGSSATLRGPETWRLGFF